jgi:antitoxin component YwqK of YwqJK toxin-antitoxin module
MNKLILLCALAIVACGPSEEQSGDAQGPTTLQPDSLAEGMHRYEDPQGRKVMEGAIHNAQREGIWTSYHPNGKVRSRSEYVNGVLEGPTLVFRENGALLYDGQYRHGKQVGSWRFYGEAGQVERTVLYDTAGTVTNSR